MKILIYKLARNKKAAEIKNLLIIVTLLHLTAKDVE